MARKQKPRRQEVPAPIDLSQFISLPEAARMADVADTWMRRLVREGKVAGVKIGRNYLVNKSSAAAFQRHPTAGRPRGSSGQRDEQG
jgi:hypothetical protein